MIEAIKEKLEEIDSNVQYGICRKKNNSWDCLLIRKVRLGSSGTSKLDYLYYVSVCIIREDEIPEGMELDVIAKMRELGWKKTDADARYEYTLDSNEVTVEMCVMEFSRCKKRNC